MLALSLTEMINAESSQDGDHVRLDAGRVARLALVHDLAESLVTDLPRQTSELMGRDAKHALEDSGDATSCIRCACW